MLVQDPPSTLQCGSDLQSFDWRPLTLFETSRQHEHDEHEHEHGSKSRPPPPASTRRATAPGRWIVGGARANGSDLGRAALMACHMVAVPASIDWQPTERWNGNGAENVKPKTPSSSAAVKSSIKAPWMRSGPRSLRCTPRDTQEKSLALDWLTYLTTCIAAGGAEACYDWLGESAAWAAMTVGDEDVCQKRSAIKQLAAGSTSPRCTTRVETISIDTLQLSCAAPLTPKTPSSARASYSSSHAPWMKAGSRPSRCTPRKTPPGACAPRTLRGTQHAVLPSTSASSVSSTEMLLTDPSLLLPAHPRGLNGLAQNHARPCEPTTPPPQPVPPTMLALELEQNVSVTNTKLENGVGLYEITWSDKSDSVHTVWRRYNDFNALHTSLCNDHLVGAVVETIAFPPKRPMSSFSRSQRERLLDERRDNLENYLMQLILEGIVTPGKSDAAGELLAAFLTDN